MDRNNIIAPSICHLPKEILTYLISCLDKNTQIPLLFVNKQFYHLSSNQEQTSHNQRIENDLPYYAAINGYTSLLQWSVEYLKYPLDSEICAAAAGSGHLEALKWLRKRGCP